jgi:predicted nucleic acid-binding protein
MIVVDASAILEVLLQTPMARRIEARLFASGEILHAPYLLDVEVMHALRRYASEGVIDDRRGRQAIADLTAWPMTRHRHDILLLRIWVLRHNLTAYDAAYVALAEILDVPLVTCDGRLARSVGHHVTIDLLPSYSNG